jgi:hypothetical protein
MGLFLAGTGQQSVSSGPCCILLTTLMLLIFAGYVFPDDIEAKFSKKQSRFTFRWDHVPATRATTAHVTWWSPLISACRHMQALGDSAPAQHTHKPVSAAALPS